jgi:L-ascorbate metabolism protein UlaG (beta-lactamase superfamily)
MKKWLFVLLVVVFTSMTVWGAEQKVAIICDDADPQFEAVSPEGIRVLMDIANPSLLSSPPTAKDLLITTHSHPDHYLSSFTGSFPGQQLKIKTGVLQTDGVKITGIASSHTASGEFLPEGGSNYIYLIEMGGLRIVHFGDIGQDKLTVEQLSVLGEVDIAITQFSNPFSSMNIENRKGFNLMDQVKPKLIIPTHIDEATAKYAAGKWAGFYIAGPLKVGKADLAGGKTKILFMESWGKICKGMKIAKRWPSD